MSLRSGKGHDIQGAVEDLSWAHNKIGELETELARLREDKERLWQKCRERGDELARLENELEVEVDAHARLVSTNAKLQKALQTGRCPRCGEWFRDDPKTRNAFKETT